MGLRVPVRGLQKDCKSHSCGKHYFVVLTSSKTRPPVNETIKNKPDNHLPRSLTSRPLEVYATHRGVRDFAVRIQTPLR